VTVGRQGERGEAAFPCCADAYRRKAGKVKKEEGGKEKEGGGSSAIVIIGRRLRGKARKKKKERHAIFRFHFIREREGKRGEKEEKDAGQPGPTLTKKKGKSENLIYAGSNAIGKYSREKRKGGGKGV